MCGIYGKASEEKLTGTEVVNCNEKLRHRGPDGGGVLLFSRGPVDLTAAAEYDIARSSISSAPYDVALAHRRLAIVDPKGGIQPMCNEDATVWITFNGEIYNFQELRIELEQAGHRFVSDHSDTEVIVHAWEQWGKECVHRFNGMFAFVLYDANRHQLFMARDRVGKKPLYYRCRRGMFEFASEIGALQSTREIEPRALNFFLATGYIPGALALYKDVAKLRPAHAAVLDLRTWSFTDWQYWTLPPFDSHGVRKEEDLVDELDALLLDAVKLRLVSDVPLGIFLSGGLDSSLVAAMAARVAGGKPRTFTIALPGMGHYDEAGFARTIAQSLGTEHTELAATSSALEILPSVLGNMGEPLGDSSLLPTWMVSRLGRRHVTVALGGDGGDELFAGYGHYRSVLRATERFAQVPQAVWQLGAAFSRSLPLGTKGRNWLYSMRGSPSYSQVWSTSYFSPPSRRWLLEPPLHRELDGVWEEPEEWKLSLMQGGTDLLDQLARLDFLSYLPEDIMVKVDRASMLNSLEVRAPWLDHRIVEFAFGKVPSSLKVHQGTGKWLAKRLAARLLPKDFQIERKQGFSIPLDRWLVADAKFDIMQHLPTNSRLFRQKAIHDLLAGERKGRANGARLFALMCMQYATVHK